MLRLASGELQKQIHQSIQECTILLITLFNQCRYKEVEVYEMHVELQEQTWHMLVSLLFCLAFFLEPSHPVDRSTIQTTSQYQRVHVMGFAMAFYR